MVETEKALVTGAHGFIGHRLAQSLLRTGSSVYELQREDWKDLQPLVSALNPTHIYHLAAYGNHYYQTEIDTTYQVNVNYLLLLLQAAKNQPIKSFINVGSSSEYGRKTAPMRESDVLQPETYYAASKAAGTLLARTWAIREQQPVVTVRPFSVYGPGEAFNRFIPTAIRCAQSGEELRLSPGVHDWIYIDDMVEGIRCASANAVPLQGEVLNIGSGKQYSNDEIVCIIEQLMHTKINVRKVSPLRNYDTNQSWVADISRAVSHNWSPKIDITEGLTRTIDHYARKTH